MEAVGGGGGGDEDDATRRAAEADVSHKAQHAVQPRV